MKDILVVMMKDILVVMMIGMTEMKSIGGIGGVAFWLLLMICRLF